MASRTCNGYPFERSLNYYKYILYIYFDFYLKNKKNKYYYKKNEIISFYFLAVSVMGTQTTVPTKNSCSPSDWFHCCGVVADCWQQCSDKIFTKLSQRKCFVY